MSTPRDTARTNTVNRDALEAMAATWWDRCTASRAAGRAVEGGDWVELFALAVALADRVMFAVTSEEVNH